MPLTCAGSLSIASATPLGLQTIGEPRCVWAQSASPWCAWLPRLCWLWSAWHPARRTWSWLRPRICQGQREADEGMERCDLEQRPGWIGAKTFVLSCLEPLFSREVAKATTSSIGRTRSPSRRNVEPMSIWNPQTGSRIAPSWNNPSFLWRVTNSSTASQMYARLEPWYCKLSFAFVCGFD